MQPVVLLGLFVLGCCTGILSGMMGIGGGMIMVPFLLWALAHQGLDPAVLIKVAIATSLTTILFTSLSSVRSHQRRGAVRWPVVLAMAPGILVGTFLAAQVVRLAPHRPVTLFFVAFLLWSSYRMMKYSPKSVTRAATGAADANPPRALTAVTGVIVGLISALVGAGGGFMTVPFLAKRGVPLPHAVGTSSACGFPIALAGAAGYAVAGMGLGLAGPMIGFIHWPALLSISAGSVLTAPLGARLAHSLPTELMKRILAGGLFVVGITMGYRVIFG